MAGTIEIVDREDIISRLVESLRDKRQNVNYALIGPRQIGKTTILREVARTLGEAAIVVHLDFSLHRYSPEDFSRTLVQSLTTAFLRRAGGRRKLLSRVSHVLQALKELRRLRFSLSLGVDEQGNPQVSFRPELAEKRINEREVVELAFAYATKIAEESRTRVVVILDEFQHLAEFASYPGLKGILDIYRHAVDERGNVCYVVSGSRIHFLTKILGDGRSPLFGRFTIIVVGELEDTYAAELYKKARPKASPEETRLVRELVGGHPFYLLAMAENKRENEAPPEAYRRLLTEPTGALYLYAQYILAEDLGSHAKARQSRFRKILYALRERTLTVSEISKQTGIAITSLPWYLQQLISYDLVMKSTEGYSVKERVLRDYLANIPLV